nr:heavy metal-associated domain, HMA [Tanacetum cinerariifolium]
MVEQEDVLKVVRKTRRNGELWPFPYNLEYVGFTEEYANLYHYHSDPTTYFQAQQPNTSLRHHVHGYNGQEHCIHQELTNSIVHGSQTPFVAFVDENVNALYDNANHVLHVYLRSQLNTDHCL